MQTTVLIIDDEKKLAALLSRTIELEGYRVLLAHTGKAGLQLLIRETIHLVISDVKLPDGNGVELVKLIKEQNSYTEVICLTAYGTIADGVLAIKNGAFDYLVKGDDNDKIIPLLVKASEKALLQYKIYKLEQQLIQKHSFETIIGSSAEIKQAISLATRVAPTDTTVLLLGQTGTGKEVFAQAIHYNSDRKAKSFVAVNCSAFSHELLESEVFGYKAGAFTGAVKDKRGLLEEANGGTLFLDEIGEMPVDLQAKLLRVMESGEFIKVGDTKVQHSNIRLIAATNRRLEVEIENGRFRQDLFYRLSVFTIHLPSLQERREDIAALANYFLKQFALKINPAIDSMDSAFIQRIETYPWKGNIRELKNAIERAVILCDSTQLTPDLLPFDSSDNSSGVTLWDMSAVERQHIQKALRYMKGNKTDTAKLINIGLTTLYRKIDEYKL